MLSRILDKKVVIIQRYCYTSLPIRTNDIIIDIYFNNGNKGKKYEYSHMANHYINNRPSINNINDRTAVQSQ